MTIRAALVAVLAAGCYSPSYQDCVISCAVSNVCPSGLDCIGGVCRTMTGECGGSGMDDAFVPIGTWQFRKKITMRAVNSAATNFPLLVRRPVDSDLANFAQSDGGDLRFTTLDLQTVPYEIEKFVESTGELVAWVKVPTVSAMAPTELWMYYGNPDTPDLQTPRAVWDADYGGVWHLSDTPGSPVIKDSSPNILDGVKSTPNAPAPVSDGKIGNAHLFSGPATERLSIGELPSKLGGTAFTFEAWIMRDSNPTFALPRHLFAWSAVYNVKPIIVYMDDGAPATMPPGSMIVQINGVAIPGTINTIPAATWVHIAVSSGGAVPSTLVLINGAQQPTNPNPGNLTLNNSDVTIAGTDVTGTSTVGLDGRLDEVRYSKIARSRDYLTLSYLTQNDSALLTFGNAENVPP
jgi:hypothetical protein